MALLQPIRVVRFIPEPSAVQKARNLVGAGIEVAKAIVQNPKAEVIVPAEVEAARLALCRACPQWVEEGNAGWGKCRLCGCTRLKHKLAALTCPLNPPKWTAYIAPVVS